jgi:hypothetical protein
VAPCQYGMGRPRVGDQGDSLQIWAVAANILNKQSQSTRGGPPACYEMLHRTSEKAGSREHGNEH